MNLTQNVFIGSRKIINKRKRWVRIVEFHKILFEDNQLINEIIAEKLEKVRMIHMKLLKNYIPNKYYLFKLLWIL